MSEKGPVNIIQIKGCLLEEVPFSRRRGSEIVCTEWQNFHDKQDTGEMKLDEVDETKGTASCEYSECAHCATPNQ